MSYSDADLTMSHIYTTMNPAGPDLMDGLTLSEPAFSAHEVFDAGEYNHGDGHNPVETYTKIMIRKILVDA